MNPPNATPEMHPRTVWSFDLGKASIGEAVRYVSDNPNDPRSNEFLHKASLLIPAEFASTKDAATRRRMWRTRQAHKAREAWLDEVWLAAKIADMPEPLRKREPGKVDANGNPIPKNERKKKGKWVLAQKGDYRLEREFAPRQFKKNGEGERVRVVYRNDQARDGAPAATKEDFEICYNSALLRIKLLRGEKLVAWQIYKALHSASQKRGYGRVPWAGREAGAKNLPPEELEKLLKKQDEELAKKDPAYKASIDAWKVFRAELGNCGLPDDGAAYRFPCYYDAWKMGLWSPSRSEALEQRIDCRAESTRKVRFDRPDVDREIAALARQAAAQLPALAEAFARWKREGWTLRDDTAKRAKSFVVAAADFGEFLVHGPAGEPLGEAQNDFAEYLEFRTSRGIHPGSADDWMGATAQKTPRFDNRIVNDCALIARDKPNPPLQVCNVEARFNHKTGRPYPDSLLASEVTFLKKLKDTFVEDEPKPRKLKVEEVRKIFAVVTAEAMAVKPTDKNAEKKVVERYALTKSDWDGTKGIKELKLRPVTNHEVVKPPKPEGRSRFSRPALRLMRALILSGQKPSEFHRRLLAREAALLDEIGMDLLDVEPVRPVGVPGGKKEKRPARRPHVLVSDLKFLADLSRKNSKGEGNTWEDLHFPEQRLDALEARHKDEAGKVDVGMAVRELLGTINDPVVRHRLAVFAERLTTLQFGDGQGVPACGFPEEVVLEFVREDFMGDDAKAKLKRFQNDRETARKNAKQMAAGLGVGERSGQLKYELLAVQGGKCLYCQQDFKATDLADYRIEHIVPRKQGGPDAMVNYVLAHESCNDAKGEMTPFQWKHGKDGWSGYQQCVELHAAGLRNKKVQLLLREDASELVQRYTALAETAWIAKLAQTIVSLHFGWRNGNDFSGPKPVKRVTVISGGLTARIRRKYRLNSLLAPLPGKFVAAALEKAAADKGSALTPEETTAVTREAAYEWESVAEKNRDDDRHHALDAMVINFLPQWTRHADKEHFFRFPEKIHKNAQAFFRDEIDQVTPEKKAFEKPVLEEKFYGLRSSSAKAPTKASPTVVRRLEKIEDLPYKTENMKRIYDSTFSTARKRIANIRDLTLQQMFSVYFDEHHPTESNWRDRCTEGFFQVRKDGTKGARIRRLLLDRGTPDEYLDMSKDGTGGLRRGEPHKGQLIYWDGAGALQILPVFAHGSPLAEREKIEALGGKAKFYEFFRAGCTVTLDREVPAEKYSRIIKNEAKQSRRIKPTQPLPSGSYLLGTISAKNHDVVLELANGTRIASPLRNLVEAGMKRMR